MSSGAAAPPERTWRPAWRLGIVAVVVVVAFLVVRRFVGDIDWGQVRDSLAHLDWWQLPVLVVGLLVRQALNALPLALYIEGCSPAQAFVNDQAAILMTTVAPPPTDVVMRLSMFGSWGITTSAGLAGTAMNTVSFSLVVVWLSFRDPAFAASTGNRAGRLARRVRPAVDPEAWSASVTAFRSAVVGRIGRTLPLSILALVGMVLVDALLIVLSVRFVGVSAQELSTTWIVTAFLAAYPLTLFPFSGLGLLDAVVVATLVDQAGTQVEAPLVAALIIWRVVTIGTPLRCWAACASGWWRMTTRSPAG